MTFVSGVKVDAVAKESMKALSNDGPLVSGPSSSSPSSGSTASCQRCAQNSCMVGVGVDTGMAFNRFRAHMRRRCSLCSTRAVSGPESERELAATRAAGEIAAGLDMRQVVDRICDIWGYCMLTVGTFIGGPHPGNMLLQED